MLSIMSFYFGGTHGELDCSIGTVATEQWNLILVIAAMWEIS